MDFSELQRKYYADPLDYRARIEYHTRLMEIYGYLPAYNLATDLYRWFEEKNLLDGIQITSARRMSDESEVDVNRRARLALERRPLSPFYVEVELKSPFGYRLEKENDEGLRYYIQQYGWNYSLSKDSYEYHLLLHPGIQFIYDALETNEEKTGHPVKQSATIQFGGLILESLMESIEYCAGGPLSTRDHEDIEELMENIYDPQIRFVSKKKGQEEGWFKDQYIPIEHNWDLIVTLRIKDDLIMPLASTFMRTPDSRLLGDIEMSQRCLQNRFPDDLNEKLGRLIRNNHERTIAPDFIWTRSEQIHPLGFADILVLPIDTDILIMATFSPTTELWLELLGRNQ